MARPQPVLCVREDPSVVRVAWSPTSSCLLGTWTQGARPRSNSKRQTSPPGSRSPSWSTSPSSSPSHSGSLVVGATGPLAPAPEWLLSGPLRGLSSDAGCVFIRRAGEPAPPPGGGGPAAGGETTRSLLSGPPVPSRPGLHLDACAPPPALLAAPTSPRRTSGRGLAASAAAGTKDRPTAEVEAAHAGAALPTVLEPHLPVLSAPPHSALPRAVSVPVSAVSAPPPAPPPHRSRNSKAKTSGGGEFTNGNFLHSVSAKARSNDSGSW